MKRWCECEYVDMSLTCSSDKDDCPRDQDDVHDSHLDDDLMIYIKDFRDWFSDGEINHPEIVAEPSILYGRTDSQFSEDHDDGHDSQIVLVTNELYDVLWNPCGEIDEGGGYLARRSAKRHRIHIGLLKQALDSYIDIYCPPLENDIVRLNAKLLSLAELPRDHGHDSTIVREDLHHILHKLHVFEL